MKVIFAGTPAIAEPVLKNLCQTKSLEIVAVYTQPDRPAGRGRHVQPSPIKVIAQNYGIPIEQPTSLGGAAAHQRLQYYQPDLIVVMAYGLMLPRKMLYYPRWGCINIHLSLLPRWRGATPIQQAILNGDTETGVSIVRMIPALDAGDILTTARTLIQPSDNQETLGNRLGQMSSQLLVSTLPALFNQSVEAVPQDPKEITYAPKIQKSDAEIRWTDTATVIHRKIRAYYGWPVAYASYKSSVLRVWQAQPSTERFNEPVGTFLTFNHVPIVVCGQKTGLILERVQWPGKPVIQGSDFCSQMRNGQLKQEKY